MAPKSRRAKANVLNLKKAVVANNKFRRVLRGVKKGGGKVKKHVKKTSEIQLDHLTDVFDKTNQLKQASDIYQLKRWKRKSRNRALNNAHIV